MAHHSSQEHRPEDYYSNVVSADGKYLGPYVPYVGDRYFNMKPRILIYAMAQNLAGATGHVKACLSRPDRGMLRHYYNQAARRIAVTPYDSGHLKVIAALLLSVYPTTSFKPSANVDELIAVTNFVKFSFFRVDKNGSRLDANPPLDIYDVMWEHYCRYEVGLLQPDLIIGVGNDVAHALAAGLGKDGKPGIVARVPFPGRLNLNSRWVPEGKRLIRTSGYDPAPDKAAMYALLAGTPDNRGLIRRAIETDWYYFTKMKRCLTNRVATLS
jgi:hypothetical protein